jgi:hypothetical protein
MGICRGGTLEQLQMTELCLPPLVLAAHSRNAETSSHATFGSPLRTVSPKAGFACVPQAAGGRRRRGRWDAVNAIHEVIPCA